MLEYETRTRQFIKKHSLIEKGDKVAVGVSGGPDSLSLLFYLHQYKEEFGIEVYALHLDHMFRGEQSYEDLRFVTHFCRERNIPVLAEQIDVGQRMKEQNGNLQETARKVRYEFYQKGMQQFSANKLALAHHGDDQVETVLMKLTKGAAKKSGIPALRAFGEGTIIRPLLALTKEMINQYCHYFDLQPRHDPSNDKTYYTRNRFRQTMLPFLKNENPRVHDQFQRFSEEIDEDELLLQELTEHEMNKVWEKKEKEVQVKIKAFHMVPLPLQRRGIHLILNYLYKGHTAFSYIHIQQVLQLLRAAHPSGSLDLPHGLKVRREYDRCLFGFYQEEKKAHVFTLEMGQKLVWPYGGEFTWQEMKDLPAGAEYFIPDLTILDLPFIVRTRQAGDRMSLKGMQGSKKLKDIFINEKISLEARDQWPIVTDDNGELLWIPGLKKSSLEKTSKDGNTLILVYIKQSSSRGQTNC